MEKKKLQFCYRKEGMWFGWEIRLGGCKSGYGKECLKPEWGKIDYPTNDFRFPFVNSFTYSPSIYWADIVALMIQSYARHSPFLFIDKMKKAKAIYSELAIARESATFWASQVALVAQLVKNLPVMWETWGWILGWENPWGRESLPTPIQLNENSGLESSMNCTVLGVAKSGTRLSDFHFTSGGASGKNLPVNSGDTRDADSIPGSGRSSGGGQGNPL